MAWLRLDDGFATHPKVLALSEPKRWRWVALLLACARHSGQGGRVTPAMLKAAGLQAPELVELGLLDPASDVTRDEWRVHDWDDFNRAATSAARRQQRYRERQRSAEVSGESENRYVTRDDNVTVASRARSRPVPVVTSLPTSEVDGEGDDIDFEPAARPKLPPELAGAELNPSVELLVARLLSLLDVDEARADYVRGAARRLPEGVVAGLVELLGGPEGARVRDRTGYAIGTLRRELEARGL